jgi:hypothetical protein
MIDDLDQLKARRDELHGVLQEALAAENLLVHDAFTPENPGSAYEKWQALRRDTIHAVELWHAANEEYLKALNRRER